MAVTTWTEEDVELILDKWASDKLARGEMIYDMQKWRGQARERVVQNERSWTGYIEGTVRAMSEHDDDTLRESGPAPAAEVLRRLYEAKHAELQKFRVPEPDRSTIAVDYACSSIHALQHQPFPAGGIGQLEDELYASIGLDRSTGLRFTPRAS